MYMCNVYPISHLQARQREVIANMIGARTLNERSKLRFNWKMFAPIDHSLTCGSDGRYCCGQWYALEIVSHCSVVLCCVLCCVWRRGFMWEWEILLQRECFLWECPSNTWGAFHLCSSWVCHHPADNLYRTGQSLIHEGHPSVRVSVLGGNYATVQPSSL